MTGGAIHKAGMKAVSKIIKSEYARSTVVKIAQNSIQLMYHIQLLVKKTGGRNGFK